ncbi:MAG: type II toxin-antitoxin system HicA family toxin [Candidatus Eremiobacteraeota bacterium]|nr:type II toxin-antitoxin system HicA family toxin [Candidatus Eremiobacteraeota bacterium]
MARLPVCSGDEAIKTFMKAGWLYGRTKGSHVTLYKPMNPIVLTIPRHTALDRGLLRDQIKKSGMTVDRFVKLLKEI